MMSALPVAILALALPHQWTDEEIGHLLLLAFFKVYSLASELIPAPHEVPRL